MDPENAGTRSIDEHPRGRRPVMAGVEVRQEDVETQRGLHLAEVVVKVSAVVILLLALAQFAVWWLDRPPGGAGMGLLIGDTIRLVVVSALLWAAADVIQLLIKSHYDLRAARILLARQTYMMRQMGIHSGEMPPQDAEGARRADDQPHRGAA
ncbi:MAG TPA: hypothetical protein VEW03_11530 [Longimicrobiaceae bacterium]|nr:hypothetical protein [Longimicrobiaceae bacterium]